MGLCPEHQFKYDEGYIALVEVDNNVDTITGRGTIKIGDENRTGLIAHIRVAVFENLTDAPVPKDNKGENLPLLFVDIGVIPKLKQVVQE